MHCRGRRMFGGRVGGHDRDVQDADDVLRIIDRLMSADIRVWVDGGWGVDALLGRQTRRHRDLDLALRLADVERALDVLAELGYRVVDDELPSRVDLRADDDRRVDIR